jgi:Branched-chain amino acid transport system / permease component
MRFIFKTNYAQDIALAKHGGHVFWYAALMVALVAAPFVLPEYWLAQLTFVLIYSIVGLGLMLLAGFTGLFSIGHAAFLGVGAYTQAVLTNMGWPFPIALAVAAGLSAAVGVVARAAREGHLFGDCHAVVWIYSGGSLCPLGIGDAWQRGLSRQVARDVWLECQQL